jgi:amino acid adenylation domain-containing protein
LCIPHLLAHHAKRIPDAVAILAPGRTPLTYKRLHRHIVDAVQMLPALGLGGENRIALALPNGPEMAVAFLAVAAGATCAPLNPASSTNELDFALADRGVKALIVQTGMASPAHAVARARGIPIIELSPALEAEAGLFTLTGSGHLRTTDQGSSQPDDVALVLHTSGTTSRPKIVALTHANICTVAHHMRVSLELVESDRCLNVQPLFHSHGLLNALLGSLMAGASIVCAPGFYAPQFFAWLAEFRPTWYTAVPTIHQAILTRAALNREIIARCPLRLIRSGSAALPRHVLAELERVFEAPVIGAYGMTEASLIASNPLPPRMRKPDSVGVAVGLEVAIMDEVGTILPAGEIGEIVVRGAGVMQGYDHDPLANESAFTHGWFRTGDQGYLDGDGYLFITGRLKEIINRGGEKIVPLEVDEVLMAHPAVAQAVTFAMPDAQLGEDIAAAVVLRPNVSATDRDIRRFVATRLADFKIPRQVLIVEEIPKGPTGKLQRLSLAKQLGLAAPGQLRPPMRRTGFIAPRTPVEEMLVGLWVQVLEVEYVGIHDDFFQLGGDSILAMQLVSRIREVTHLEVSLLSFLETPTVSGMARSIAATSQATLNLQVPPLQARHRDGALPLSYAQQRLWFLEQLGLSGHAYHLREVIRLCGRLQVTALTQSLQEIIKRHEALRTTFVHIEGEPYQVVGRAVQLPLPVVDLQELPECEREAQVRTLALEEARRPFDLAQGPLLRATLVRFAKEEHVLLLTMHHIVSDGWSHGVFWGELAALYEAFATGKPSPLPALAIQYADFAHWQRQWLQGEVLDTQLAYWKRLLAGMSTLQLPADHARPAVQTFRGAKHSLALSPTLTQALKALSQRQGVTLFMTLLATFQTLLHRYTGQNDIAVGSLIANRNRAEIEGLIGFFVNTLVLRTDLSGDPSFRELLERVREVALGAYSHQDLPFEKLLEALRPPRDLSRTPLFQVLFLLQNAPTRVPDLAGLVLVPLEIDTETSKFDLTLALWETPEGMHGWFEYSTDVFDADTITRMGGHLQTLLEGIVADPEQRLSMLPLLTADEQHRLLVEWNHTKADYPKDACIHELFEAQVERVPDAVAVVHQGEQLTYRELNRRANQVAHYLRALGVAPKVRVGLCIERSLAMVVGLLGILKSGGAYVPLDPAYPPARLAFMLEDAQIPVLLTQKQLMEGLPDHGAEVICLDSGWRAIAQHSVCNSVSAATADSMAYLLYTSGSTGRPKGVLGVHRATLNILAWMWQAYPFASHDVCCHKTSVSFGDSIQELLGPLLSGIRTVLIPDGELKDLPRFVQALAMHQVTRLILVPSLLRALLDTYDDLQSRLPSLKLWFVSGEILSRELCQRFLEVMPQSRLINIYGTSEVSDDITWYDSGQLNQQASRVPIGRPIANTQVYLLDRHLQPMPIGVPGELHVAGAGLSRGYLNHPELTAEKFMPHPFRDEPGARLYKTGDLARYLPDGNIDCLGRLDHQVKVRGIRIELGEIEAVLRQHPGVRETVVIAREDVPGERRLVGYMVSAQKQAPTVRDLRSFLQKMLPNSMVPSTFVWLDALPLTPNGKIDRRALPSPDRARPVLEEPFVPPRTPVEQQVAAIWSTVLGLERVGIHDNFFELGGHSLLATQLLSRIRNTMHVEVSLLSFFETPTVAGLVGSIEPAMRAEQGRQAPAIMSVSREHALPASIAQEQLWIIDQVLPGLPLFNIPYALRLKGLCHVATLQRSCDEIIRRHEALRTTFAVADGRLVQVIAPTLSVPLTAVDLRALPTHEREGEAQRLAEEEVRQPFNLAQGPLLRLGLLHMDEQEYLLLVTMHHIIDDGWSMGVFAHELAVLYDAFSAGTPSPLPELSIQYADFAHWQRQWQRSEAMAAQLAYWQEQLREPLPVLKLPTDRPRGPALSFRTARQTLALSGELSEALKNLSHRDGSTLFMTLVAAFNMLLYGYTGQEDLRVATLIANRHRRETEELIGLLVNTVVLRTDLGGNPTCREVLQRVRATTLAAYAHQDLPFEDLVQSLERTRGLQRKSLCPAMIILQNAMLRPLQRSSHTLSFQEAEPSLMAQPMMATTFDIVLMLRERQQGLTGSCLYKTDLFDAATINRMLGDLQYVLERLTVEPEQLLSTFRSLGGERGRVA